MVPTRSMGIDRLGPTVFALGPLISQCADYLKASWNVKDGGCPSDFPGGKTSSSMSNTWSTASCVYALQLIGDPYCWQVRRGLDWLSESQNDNGSWPVFKDGRNRSGEEYLICTVNAILAIHETLKRAVHPIDLGTKNRLEGAVKWVLFTCARNEMIGNEEVCSWGPKPPEQAPRASSVETCLAIRALREIHDYCSQQSELKYLVEALESAIRKGVAWLSLAYRDADSSFGGWGATFEDSAPRSFPTALALQALDACGAVLQSDRLKKALAFLKSGVREDGFCPSYVEFKTFTRLGLGMEQAVTYYSAPTIVETLLQKEPNALSDSRIMDSFLWLVDQMKEGKVRLDIDPRITIWPTREWALGLYRIAQIISPRWFAEMAHSHFSLRQSVKLLERKLDDFDRYVDFSMDSERSGFRDSLNKALLVVQALVAVSILMGTGLVLALLKPEAPWQSVAFTIAGGISAIAGIIINGLKKPA